jgi:hypothetical protein
MIKKFSRLQHQNEESECDHALMSCIKFTGHSKIPGKGRDSELAIRNYERETHRFLMASKALAPILNCSKHSSSGIAQGLINSSSKTCALASFLPHLLQSRNKELFLLFSSYSPFHFNLCEVTVHG